MSNAFPSSPSHHPHSTLDIFFRLGHSGRMAKTALGRGLGALLGGVTSTPKPTSVSAAETALDSRERVERVPLGRIRPCPFQPRKDFPEEAIRELADSIKEQGIVQPLIVRPSPNGYELIAGERRWRAAQSLGLADVPVIVREADDRTVLELALIENLQRENLNPIEEALGYAQLIEQFQLRQEEAASKVGKSRTSVANALRLLKLAPEIQRFVRDGRLSVGHAKVILGLEDPSKQKSAATRVMKEGWSVRQTEEFIARLQKLPAEAAKLPAAAPRDIHVADLEHKLLEHFGAKVSLHYRQGKGAVEIRFFSDDDLDRILQIIGIKPD